MVFGVPNNWKQKITYGAASTRRERIGEKIREEKLLKIALCSIAFKNPGKHYYISLRRCLRV
jgi:hypothetical protein